MTNNEKYAELPWHTEEAARKKYLENLAPVAFFTYNRPKHTIKTLEALKRNAFAENTRLYVFSDGPRNENDKEKVAEIRNYLDNLYGFREIRIMKRENNAGLAASIIFGVTTLVEKYGKVIVIEDDILTTKYFLQYMNDALEIYKNEEKVMAISSFSCFENKEGLPPTYFTKDFNCWGWATWQRCWQYFEWNPEKILRENPPEERKKMDWNGWGRIEGDLKEKSSVWEAYFGYVIAKHNGLVLHNSYDLCKNIGSDGTGEHPATAIYYRSKLPDIEVKQFSLDIKENELAEEREKGFNEIKNSYWQDEARMIYSLNSSTIAFWRSNRGLGIVKCLSRDTSWLIMGDGRSEMLAPLLKSNGFKKAISADTVDYYLNIASRRGIIDDFLVLDSAKFEIPSNRYDYVFCRNIYLLSSKPYATIYEMLRVAKKGIVLTGFSEVASDDNLSIRYDINGNFIFDLSVRELLKIALSLNLPAICRYGYNDVYIENCEFEFADKEKSPVFRYITEEISNMDKRVFSGEKEYNMVSIALFKQLPDDAELENLKNMNALFQELPKNPHNLA